MSNENKVVLPEPVGEVGSGFAMVWAGTGPISPICQKWGINVGTKLYTEQQVRALLALPEDVRRAAGEALV